jgi:magnesium-dependent phosphatase-1
MYKNKLDKYIVKLHKLSGGVNNSEAASEAIPMEVSDIKLEEQRSNILSEGPNPALFIFDCDYTIWPFDCDGPHPNDVYAPFTRLENNIVVDRYSRYANPYPDVPYILGALYDAGIQVAYASRNPSSRDVANLLSAIPLMSKKPRLSLLDCLRGRADLFHAYSSGGVNNKLLHFTNIRYASQFDFNNMVFFDDNNGNITHAESIGITSILLNKATGLTWDAFDNCIRRWRQKMQY